MWILGNTLELVPDAAPQCWGYCRRQWRNTLSADTQQYLRVPRYGEIGIEDVKKYLDEYGGS